MILIAGEANHLGHTFSTYCVASSFLAWLVVCFILHGFYFSARCLL